MVGFSCFHSRVFSPKAKKDEYGSIGVVKESPHESLRFKIFRSLSKSKGSIHEKEQQILSSNDSASGERSWKSDEYNVNVDNLHKACMNEGAPLRRSRSLGIRIIHEEQISPNEDENLRDYSQGFFNPEQETISSDKDSPTSEEQRAKQSAVIQNDSIFLNGCVLNCDNESPEKLETVFFNENGGKMMSDQAGSSSQSFEDLFANDTSNLIPEEQITHKENPYPEQDREDFMTSVSLKIKRVSDWVNNLQDFNPLENTSEFLDMESPQEEEPPSLKADCKESPDIESTKALLSTLSASSTTAQLCNLGLPAMPILSTFSCLKVLNLSSNSIAKITPGALPKGLHALNLSRNRISAIEGLRELSRLRVLDLSYNRIVRIGHGLASCSSIKELYLAGNKISEVEGLHRLLKLSVLDLRFNKISTVKSLDQLAPIYNSLTVIGLEGNPAQKNEGEEHLKKYVLGLLPNAAKIDRGLRSDSKPSRKGGRIGAAGLRPPPAAAHGHKSKAASPKESARSRVSHRNEGTGNHRSARNGIAIRRSQSEGTLSAV